MKKVYIFTLAVMLLIIAARLVPAEGTYTRDPGFTCSTYSVSGPSSTLSNNIVTGNKVFGFTFSDSSAGVVGLYDVAATSSTSNNFGEAYVAAGGIATVVFPFPRKISNGLVVGFQNSTGRVIVYYE